MFHALCNDNIENRRKLIITMMNESNEVRKDGDRHTGGTGDNRTLEEESKATREEHVSVRVWWNAGEHAL